VTCATIRKQFRNELFGFVVIVAILTNGCAFIPAPVLP